MIVSNVLFCDVTLNRNVLTEISRRNKKDIHIYKYFIINLRDT